MNPSIRILASFRHLFKQGLKAIAYDCRISEMEANETVSYCTAQNWFKHLKDRDLSFEIMPISGQPFVVNYNALQSKIEGNLTSKTQKP